MEMQQKNYKVKDVEMLLASATIINAAIANKPFLESKRSVWSGTYFDDIKAQVDTTIQQYLGVDSAKALRQATQVVQSIQSEALYKLSEIKVQIVVDFEEEPAQREEILNTLGFKQYYERARKGDQEALIDLLFQFKLNLVPDLKTQLTEKGIAEDSLNAVVANADTLKEADVLQENSKGGRKALTAEGVQAFNAVYKKVIGICKIAANFYKDSPALQEQFSFSKTVKKMNFKKDKGIKKAA